MAWRVHSANSAAAVISNVQLFWFVGPAAISDGPTACTDERASAGRGSAAGARSTFMIHHYARSSSRYLFSLHFTLPAADIKRWTCSLVVVIINRAASATSAKIRTAERSALQGNGLAALRSRGRHTCGSLIGIEQTDSGTGEPGEVSCVISARGMSVYL